MKASIKKQTTSNAKNLGGKKELIMALSLVVNAKDRLREAVTVRFYMGRSAQTSVIYCSIWAWGNGVNISGYGSAGGGGYCKKSAALARAMESAGIDLSEPIGGCGMAVAREAIEAVGRALGFGGRSLIVDH